MKILLLSNSTNFGEPYLKHAAPLISYFSESVSEFLFIPYAAVTISYDEYEAKVNEALAPYSKKVKSIHHFQNQEKAVHQAETIVIGGGNTFILLFMLQSANLLNPIRRKVKAGTPYIGWSAGANLAGPSIKTTNDMPIVETENFGALWLVNFQINPHYTSMVLPNHNGESRDQRIQEFVKCNPDHVVLALPEGSYFRLNDEEWEVGGDHETFVFSKEGKQKMSDVLDFGQLIKPEF